MFESVCWAYLGLVGKLPPCSTYLGLIGNVLIVGLPVVQKPHELMYGAWVIGIHLLCLAYPGLAIESFSVGITLT